MMFTCGQDYKMYSSSFVDEMKYTYPCRWVIYVDFLSVLFIFIHPTLQSHITIRTLLVNSKCYRSVLWLTPQNDSEKL